MREIAKMGYTSIIITSDSNKLAEVPNLERAVFLEEIDGLQVFWLRTLKYSVAKSIRRILSWLDFEWRLFLLPKKQIPKPDAIVISSLSLLTIFNGLLLKRRYKCRLIFEVRDIWPLTIIEEGGFSPSNPLVRTLAWVERLAYTKADAIVGTMPNLREHVKEVTGNPKATYCIPMGIDDEALVATQPLPDGYEDKYLPRGKFVIAHVGTIGITNALDTFFECAQAMASDERLHFLIVGEGDLRQHYQEKYGHLKNLTFGPRVPKQAVQSVLERCDLLYFSVHVSKVWKYGQSLNKVIDYMLAGKPVVASYSGYPSMINESGCGTYVASGDVSALQEEIRKYAAMPQNDRDEIGARGKAWLMANRSYHTLALQYLAVMFPGKNHTAVSANQE